MSRRHKYTLDISVYDRDKKDYVLRNVTVEIDTVQLARHLGTKAHASMYGTSEIQGGLIRAKINE